MSQSSADRRLVRRLPLATAVAVLTGLLALALLSSPGVVSAQPAEDEVVIEGTEADYDSIQEAIDAAEDGDTILVGPGTYEAALEINVENLTLLGANAGVSAGGDRAAESEIDGVVHMMADGITLDGFTINDADGQRAIAPRSSDGTVIANNIINGGTRGIQGDFHGRPANLTIIGNSIEADYGIAGTEDITGLAIEDNTFNTAVEGIGLGEGVDLESLLHNRFVGDGVAIEDYRDPFVEVDATRNYWGTTSSSEISAMLVGDVVFDPWCTDAACTTFSDDPPSEPTPPPLPPQPDPTPEPGEVEPELENEQSEPVDSETGATVETTSANGSSARVTVPPGALPADAPEGTSVQVAAVANPDQVREQAPPPSNADVVTEFVVTLVDEDGNTISANFEEPVTLEFSVPADLVPEDATDETLVLAYWNGEQWIEVEATVTVEADGSYTLSAEVMHFTLFSIFVAPPEWGTFAPSPEAGVTLTTWQGGGYTRLAEAVGEGNSVWTTVDGEFIGYVVGAPEFVNADFVAHYPEGVPTGGTVLVAQ